MTLKKTLALNCAIMICILLSGGCQRIIQTKNLIRDAAAAIRSSNEITSIVKSDKKMSEMGEEEIKKLVEYGKFIKENADKLDYELLNKIYPDLGDKFEKELIAGVTLILKGYEEKNEDMIGEGKKLLDSWNNWFETNVDNIKPLSFLKK